ncbi:MAG: hypothetical protein OXF42_03765 [Candidatus Dadabacteria bacterium]|nr:hypothetical protein [Candidatus Dadabacteria bacterium]
MDRRGKCPFAGTSLIDPAPFTDIIPPVCLGLADTSPVPASF